MASDAQIRASRLNGSRSRGPLTPEGRARSSANAIKHGMHSRAVVLNTESKDKYDELLAAYTAELRPETPVEKDLVLTVVNATWRLNRVVSVETATIDLEIDGQRAEIEEKFAKIDAPTRAQSHIHRLPPRKAPCPCSGRPSSRLRRTLTRPPRGQAQEQKLRKRTGAATVKERSYSFAFPCFATASIAAAISAGSPR